MGFNLLDYKPNPLEIKVGKVVLWDMVSDRADIPKPDLDFLEDGKQKEEHGPRYEIVRPPKEIAREAARDCLAEAMRLAKETASTGNELAIVFGWKIGGQDDEPEIVDHVKSVDIPGDERTVNPGPTIAQMRKTGPIAVVMHAHPGPDTHKNNLVFSPKDLETFEKLNFSVTEYNNTEHGPVVIVVRTLGNDEVSVTMVARTGPDPDWDRLRSFSNRPTAQLATAATSLDTIRDISLRQFILPYDAKTAGPTLTNLLYGDDIKQ